MSWLRSRRRQINDAISRSIYRTDIRDRGLTRRIVERGGDGETLAIIRASGSGRSGMTICHCPTHMDVDMARRFGQAMIDLADQMDGTS